MDVKWIYKYLTNILKVKIIYNFPLVQWLLKAIVLKTIISRTFIKHSDLQVMFVLAKQPSNDRVDLNDILLVKNLLQLIKWQKYLPGHEPVTQPEQNYKTFLTDQVSILLVKYY